MIVILRIVILIILILMYLIGLTYQYIPIDENKLKFKMLVKILKNNKKTFIVIVIFLIPNVIGIYASLLTIETSKPTKSIKKEVINIPSVNVSDTILSTPIEKPKFYDEDIEEGECYNEYGIIFAVTKIIDNRYSSSNLAFSNPSFIVEGSIKLPGQTKKKLIGATNGDTWSFYLLGKKYTLLLKEVNAYNCKISIEEQLYN